MKFGASLRTRHVIARLEQGEDFIGALKKFFKRERAKSCVFTGLGFFSKCTLQSLNLEKRELETVFTSDALMTVANLTGNIAMMGNEVIVYATCAGSYRAFGQAHSISGMIQDARVYSIDLHITVFDDLLLTRAYDPMTGLVPIQKIHNAYDDVYAQTDMTFMHNDLSSTSMDLVELMDSGAPPLEGASEFFASPTPYPETVIRRGGKSSTSSSGLRDENASSNSGLKAKKDASAAAESGDSSSSKSGDSSSSKSGDSSSSKPGDSSSSKPSDSSNSKMSSQPLRRRIKCSASSKDVKVEYIKIEDLPLESWIKHQIFGLCTVESKHSSGTTLHIRTESSIVHEISMKVFDIQRCEPIDGKPCYVLCKKLSL